MQHLERMKKIYHFRYYGCYPGWGATGDYRKNCIETKGIVLSDTLTVIGIKSTYQNQAQLKNGVYFSHKKADNVE